MGNNILITSAAAKVLLVRAFREAAGTGRKVFAGDFRSDIAARHAADDFISLLGDKDPDFIPDLISKCRENGIGFIVPTRDGELERLAAARKDFEQAGIALHLADVEVIRICRDKRAFTDFCVKAGLPCLPHLAIEDARKALPVYIRPIAGAGGRDARKIATAEDLDGISAEYENYIVNAFVAPFDHKTGLGAREYTIDLLRSLDGKRHVGAVVRERIRIEAGESQHARVVDLPRVQKAAIDLGEHLKLAGHNTVQIFDDPARGPLIIEVNPRFGGAANLGIRAGLDSPHRLLAMLTGDDGAYAPCDIRIGMEMFRYKDDFIVEPPDAPDAGGRA